MKIKLYSPIKVRAMIDGELRECSPEPYIPDINDALFDLAFSTLTDAAKERFPETDRIVLILRENKGIFYLAVFCEMNNGFDDIEGLKDFLREQYSGSAGDSFSGQPIELGGKNSGGEVFVSLWWDGAFVKTERELDPDAFRLYDLHCRDCKYMQKIGNTDETGHALCTYPASYEPITLDMHCRYLPESSELRCGDCARLGDDFACFTCSAEDPAEEFGSLCAGFIDKHEEQFMEALAFWKLHNRYDRDRMIGLLDRFEKEFKTPLD